MPSFHCTKPLLSHINILSHHPRLINLILKHVHVNTNKQIIYDLLYVITNEMLSINRNRVNC